MAKDIDDIRIDPNKASQRASRVLGRISSNPEDVALRQLLSNASGLNPNDPYYVDNLQNLDEIVLTAQGYNADSSLAMLAAGVNPDTEIGRAIAAAQEQAAEAKRFADQQRADWRAQGEQGNAILDFLKVATGTTFAVALQPFQQIIGYNKTALGAVNTFNEARDQGADLSEAIAAGGQQFADHIEGALSQTDLAQMMVATHDNGPDVKVGWFGVEPDSESQKEAVEFWQSALGQNTYTHTGVPLADPNATVVSNPNLEQVLIPELQPNGTVIYREETVDASPSTIGSSLAYNPGNLLPDTWLQPGTTPYNLVSGTIDFITHGVDPTMYVGGGALRGGLMKTENAIRKGAEAAGVKGAADASKLRGTADDVARVVGNEGANSKQAKEALDIEPKAREKAAELDETAWSVQNALKIVNDSVSELYKLNPAAAQAMHGVLDQQALQTAAWISVHNANKAHLAGRQIDQDLLLNEVVDQALRKDAEELLTAVNSNKALPSNLSPDRVEEVAEVLGRAADAVMQRGKNLQAYQNRVQDLILKSDQTLLDTATEIAKRSGMRLPSTVGDATDLLKKQAGLIDSQGFGSVAKAMQWMMKASDPVVQKTLQAFAVIDDPGLIRELTRGKMDVDLAVDLAKTTSPEQVRAVLARGLASGQLTKSVGKLRAVRAAAQVRGKGKMNPYSPGTLSLYGKMFGEVGLGAMKWGKQLRKAKVPWGGTHHLTDTESMTDLVYDTATWAMKMNRPVGGVNKNSGFKSLTSDDPQKFRRDWMNKMMAAQTPQQRRKVWESFNSAMIERVGKNLDLSDVEIRELQRKMALYNSYRLGENQMMAEARASIAQGQGLLLNGKVIREEQDLAFLEAHLAQSVIAPNWDELRRIARSKKQALKSDDPNLVQRGARLADKVLDHYWRGAVLTIRPAYIARNMLDIQIRMYLKGHPSMFTSLPGLMALGFARISDDPTTKTGQWLKGVNKRISKMLEDGRIGDLDVQGNRLWENMIDGNTPTIDDFSDPFMKMFADRNVSHLEYGSSAQPHQTKASQSGFHVESITQNGVLPSGYISGLEHELMLQINSPMALTVLEIMRGNVPDYVSKRMTGGIVDPQDAAVDYFANGPGRKLLDNFLDGSPDMRQYIAAPELDGGVSLKGYLFGSGPNESVSLLSRWNRLTLGLDDDIIKAVKKSRVGQGTTAKVRTRRRKELRDVLQGKIGARTKTLPDGTLQEKAVGDLPVRDVQVANADDLDNPSKGFDKAFNDVNDWFFAKSGRFENSFGYLPEARYSKWEAVADYVGALNAEDAAEVVEVARKTLGSGKPGSWARSTLKKIEKEAQRAKGSGGFTKADLDNVTNKYAVEQVRDLFYNAANRNQFAHAIRFAMPFAQAWGNTLETWGKLALQNPQQVYKAGIVYEAGQGRDSNWLSDDPANPNDAFFYRDAKTDRMMVGVPLMGPAMGWLAQGLNLLPMVNNATFDPSMLSGDMPLQSMNLALQNGGGPGAGPALGLTMSYLENTGWYQDIVPDAVKEFIHPVGNTNPDRDDLLQDNLPAWFTGAMAGFGVPQFQEKAQRYLPQAVAYTLQHDYAELGTPDNPTVDPETGELLPLNQQHLDEVMRRAEGRASSLMFGRSLVQMVAPGSPIPHELAMMDDGRIMANIVIAQEYNAGIDKHGDPTQAMNDIARKYGHNAIWALMPARANSLPSTEGAWEFLKQEPELAKKYSRIVPFLNPGSGYSARFDRWRRQVGANPQMTPEQMADGVNGLLQRAQVGELERRFALPYTHPDSLTKTEFEIELDKVTELYDGKPGATYDLDRREVWMDSLASAAKEPQMLKMFPEVTVAINTYREYRDYALARTGTKTLSGRSNEKWRKWLLQKGDELGRKYPKFKLAFLRVYYPELVEPDGKELL